MKATKDVVVSIAYQVKNEDGILVDESTQITPLEYLHGHSNLIIGLENALEGHEVGHKFEVTVSPEDAYGEYLDAMVQRVPANVFQGVDEITVGMRFLADTDQGHIPVEVTEVDGDEVVVDGNHMLAGQTLTFNVEVMDLRAATEEELEHGHIHRAGGCCGDHEHDDAGCCGDADHDHDHEHAHDDEASHGCCGGNGQCQSDEKKDKKKKKKEGCCGGGGCGSHTH